MKVKPLSHAQPQPALAAVRSSLPLSLTPDPDEALSRAKQRIAKELDLQLAVTHAQGAKAAFGAQVVRDLGQRAFWLDAESVDQIATTASAPHDPAFTSYIDQGADRWISAIHDGLSEIYQAGVENTRTIVTRSLYPAPEQARGLRRRLGTWLARSED